METLRTNTDSVLGYAANEELKAVIQHRMRLAPIITPARTIGVQDKRMESFMEHWRDGYVVPGLRSCANGCTHMVPQGICVAGDYLLVTAYCSCTKNKAIRGHGLSHMLRHLAGRKCRPKAEQKPARHPSVVYLIEKKTGIYVKTVILPDKNHVGGITYYEEGKRGYIVLTGKAGKKGQGGAQLQRYSLDTFLQTPDGGILSDYVNQAEIIPTQLNNASFVSCNPHEHCLYVGYFHDGKAAGEGTPSPQGVMQKIPLTDVSWIIDNSHRKTMKIKNINVQCQLPNQMQGCEFLNDGSVLLSRSYGWRSNATLSRHFVKYGNIVTEPAWQLAVPPYLEEIAIDNETQRIYMVFESGADLYAWKTPFAIDRIVAWDLKGIRE